MRLGQLPYASTNMPELVDWRRISQTPRFKVRKLKLIPWSDLSLRLSRNTVSFATPMRSMTDHAPQNPLANPALRPLSELRRGDRAIVRETRLDAEHTATLAAMGLCASCELTICRASGSMSPCIVQIDATRLGLAPEVAQKILATIVTKPCDCPADCTRPQE